MSAIRRFGYYWLLSLLVLYDVPTVHGQSSTEFKCNIFSDNYNIEVVTCDKRENASYTARQQEIASTLLSCVDELSKMGVWVGGTAHNSTRIIHTASLQKCVDASQSDSDVCWIANGTRIVEDLRMALDQLDSITCKLERFYNIINDFDQACDFQQRQEDIAAVLMEVNETLIEWNRIIQPVVACLIPTDHCNNIDFLGNLTDLLANTTDNCTTFRDTTNGCCPEQCNCLSALISCHLEWSCDTTIQQLSNLDAEVSSSRVKERHYSRIVQALQSYSGDKEAIMKYSTAAKIISRLLIKGITLDGLLDHVDNFTDPKILALVRQTLAQLELHTDKRTTLIDYYASAGCPLLSGISVQALKEPDIISFQLAMNLCDCSEQQATSTPAKNDALCDIIFSNIYYGSSKDKFGDFKAIIDDLCPLCLVYLLNKISDWKNMVLDDTQLKGSVCDKVGSSTALTTGDLMEWAKYCTVNSGASGCRGLRPSLMAYQTSPPSPADLAACKEVFCARLCSLTSQELRTVRQVLGNSHDTNVGCLTYLDDDFHMKTPQRPVVDSIPGSCMLRSAILKRAPKNNRRRRQALSCTGQCNEVGFDISMDIPPPDVLDVSQIGTCGTTIFECITDNDLGEFRWDVDQAKALLELIRQSENFGVAAENWSSEDLQILGFIGVGFTPEELKNLGGLTDAVYEIFGVAHGWSPQQRRVLAERYLLDRDIQPQDLTPVHLARLNHIVCGLLPDEVRAIPRESVVGSTTFLGDLQRCEIGVLIEMAAHLQRHYGPAILWVEDHFSEFAIILAGLRGEDLRRVGTNLSDHVTVPFINHIPPEEFRKLSPDQTRLFTYVVAQAISRRGLCPWLSDRHKQGNIRTACSNCSYLQPGAIPFLLLVVTLISSMQENLKT